MPAAKYDLIIEEGSKFDLDITWKDEDESLIDLTGYEARMQIRVYKNSQTYLAEWTSDDYITLGGAAGTIAIEVGADVTADLHWQDFKGYYDLEIYDPNDDSNVTRILEGRVRYSREVTR